MVCCVGEEGQLMYNDMFPGRSGWSGNNMKVGFLFLSLNLNLSV